MGVIAAALGTKFSSLHPLLQAHHGVNLGDGQAAIGRGVMTSIEQGSLALRPVMALGSVRNFLFPHGGNDVPFIIENHPYRDGWGREAITYIRSFDFGDGRRGRFDSYTSYSPVTGQVVDYIGTHQDLAAEVIVGVDCGGGLTMTGGSHHVFLGTRALKLPGGLVPITKLREWVEPGDSRIQIEVGVTHPQLGLVVGYRGWFISELVKFTHVPAGSRPRVQRSVPGT